MIKPAAMVNIPFMIPDWKDRVLSALESKDTNAKALSIRAGMNETWVRDLIKRKQSPSVENFTKLAYALEVDPAWLLTGHGDGPPVIQVVGYVSAGDEWTPIDDYAQGAGLDEIEVSFNTADPIGIRVRGASMAPVYRDGDTLLCSRQRGLQMQLALNHDCVVMTTKGHGYLKRLLRGGDDTMYRLRSYNSEFEDMEDVRLQWAAPVIWVKRA